MNPSVFMRAKPRLGGQPNNEKFQQMLADGGGPSVEDVERAFGPPTDSQGDIGSSTVEIPVPLEESFAAFSHDPAPRANPDRISLASEPRPVPKALLPKGERLELMLKELVSKNLIGRDFSHEARLEWRLAHIKDQDTRERILMVMVENGWGPDHEAVIFADLFAQLSLASQDIPDQIDAAVNRALDSLISGLERYFELPEAIDQALADAASAARLNAELIKDIADRYELALRESLGAALNEASHAAASEIELRKTEAIQEMKKFERSAEDRLSLAVVKVSNDSAAIIERRLKQAASGNDYSKWIAAFFAGILLGMTLQSAFTRFF